MRLDRAYRFKRMIPAPRTTTANGQTVSAASYGSGGHASRGIVDTLGYARVRITLSKQTGTAQKLSKFYLGMQSGAATLWASCTPLSGFTSGIVLSSITTSSVSYAWDINLRQYPNRKRYLNCKVTTSTTSGNIDVRAELLEPETFPPSTTGYVSITNVYNN
jgi:hypothetical protein